MFTQHGDLISLTDDGSPFDFDQCSMDRCGNVPGCGIERKRRALTAAGSS
jgi:hypothetical protein